jgi:hypothetical protein
MSRRRYLSTEISLDARINRLATEAGDFAALCYTWMIPHAEDDASITADPEELLFRVFPGRRDKSAADLDAAINQMIDFNLVSREDRRLIFPPDAFYRYQSYIPGEKRRTAKNAEHRRQSAKNAVSPSPSPSPKEDSARKKRARSEDSDPRIKTLLTSFAEKYRDRVGSPYPVTQGKDAALLQGLLAADYDVPAIEAVMDRYFANAFYGSKAGFDIGGFKSAFSRLNSVGSKKRHDYDDGAFPDL